MLIKVDGSSITDSNKITNPDHVVRFRTLNPDYIEVPDMVMDKPIVCYEYVNGQVQLRSNWEMLKAEQAAINKGGTLSATGKVVPKRISNYQARRVLNEAGLLEEVPALIATLPPDEKSVATIEWDHSPWIYRDHLLINALGTLKGLSASQIDDLFISGLNF